MSNSFADILNDWASISIRRSMHEFGQFMRSKGITMPQITVLMHLNHGGPCQISDIGRHLGVSNPAASQLIQRLVEQKLLERHEDPADRRVKTISLTEAGRGLVSQAVNARRSWIERLAESLPPDRQEKIRLALQDLIAAADQENPNRPEKSHA